VLLLKEAPCPSNVKQLKSYLGLLAYCTKFLPNRSFIVLFIRNGEKQQEAFEKSITLLISAEFLAEACLSCCLRLWCGAVLHAIWVRMDYMLPGLYLKLTEYIERRVVMHIKRFICLDTITDQHCNLGLSESTGSRFVWVIQVWPGSKFNWLINLTMCTCNN